MRENFAVKLKKNKQNYPSIYLLGMTTAWFHFQMLHTVRHYTRLATKYTPFLFGRAEY